MFIRFVAFFLLLTNVCAGPELPVFYKAEHKTHLANAVFLGNGLALCAAHTVDYGQTEGKLLVGGLPATVSIAGADMALLKVSPSVKASPAIVPTFGPDSSFVLLDGQRLRHSYYNHYTKRVCARVVSWVDPAYIQEGFVPGMSGSGIYTSKGELVGIAETTVGLVWNLPDITGFLQAACVF